jgi:pyruvate/2-oxoglutarate dehydrogenase complex dihydrolipoamide dehydrogenase (E3) component
MVPGFSPVSARLAATQEINFIMKRLHAAHVKISATTYIKQIDDRAVVVYDVHSEQERTITGVDAVVLCTGRLPVNELAKELEGKVAQLYTIGDALAVRLFATASYEGQKFARLIGEPDAPKTFTEAFFQSNPPEFASIPAG